MLYYYYGKEAGKDYLGSPILTVFHNDLKDIKDYDLSKQILGLVKLSNYGAVETCVPLVRVEFKKDISSGDMFNLAKNIIANRKKLFNLIKKETGRDMLIMSISLYGFHPFVKRSLCKIIDWQNEKFKPPIKMVIFDVWRDYDIRNMREQYRGMSWIDNYTVKDKTYIEYPAGEVNRSEDNEQNNV